MAAIRRESSGKIELTFSDGSYCLSARVTESEDLSTTPGQINRLIRQVKLYPGLKVRFVNQMIASANRQEGSQPETEHYFLQQSGMQELVLNYNGMSIAEADAKLGQQKRLLVPRSFKSVI